MTINKRIIATAGILGLTLFLAGCPDDIAPTASITFPASLSITDADTILVRGTASLEEHEKAIEFKRKHGEEPAKIVAVRVNGIEANSDNDFANWYVKVPLNLGKNKLVVETEDSDGDIDRYADSVKVRKENTLIPNPLSVSYIEDRNELIVAGNITNAIFSVDIDSGERALISGQGQGEGPDIGNMLDFVLNPNNEVGYAADVANNVVIEVDLKTGARRLLSGGGVGTGPEMTGRARALTFDKANNRLLSGGTLDLDGAGNIAFALFAIDLLTGDRTVIPMMSRSMTQR